MRVGDGVVCSCKWVALFWGVGVFSNLLIKVGEFFNVKFRARSDRVLPIHLRSPKDFNPHSCTRSDCTPDQPLCINAKSG